MKRLVRFVNGAHDIYSNMQSEGISTGESEGPSSLVCRRVFAKIWIAIPLTLRKGPVSEPSQDRRCPNDMAASRPSVWFVIGSSP
jgi:hypothetical protein